MASLVTLVMLLAFLMGLGNAPPDRLSIKYAEDPWSPGLKKSAQVSQDKWRADPCGDIENLDKKFIVAHPWGDPGKREASQKKYQAVQWIEDCY